MPKPGASPLLLMARPDFVGSFTEDPVKDLAQDAFARLQLSVQILDLPAARALKMLQNGELDGDLARNSAITELLNNLILVPEPLSTLEIMRYCLQPDYCKNEDPQGIGGYIRGAPALSAWLQQQSLTLVGYKDATTLLMSLVYGRLNYILLDNQSLHLLRQNLQLQQLTLYTHPLPLPPQHYYMVLNKRHQHLALPLAQALKDAKSRHPFFQQFPVRPLLKHQTSSGR